MDRILLIGTNSNFPRASAAASYSGAVPESSGRGAFHPEKNFPVVPQAVERSPARRPRVSVLKAVASVALWDSGKFDTVEIAHVLDMKEALVADVLHHMREERRVRL